MELIVGISIFDYQLIVGDDMSKFKNETTITDHTTGEVITTSKTFTVKAATSEEFYMTFVQMVAPIIAKLKGSGADLSVLMALCSIMAYDNNIVYLTTSNRQKVCEKAKISPSNLSRSLRHLTDQGLISSMEGGNCIVNPIFFWKGTTDSRNKLLRDKGLEFKVQFGGKENDD